MIREFNVTNYPNAPTMYIIDSNILIAMGQLYYNGKCNIADTTDLKEFIIKARMEAIQYEFALTEICYDYNTNSQNSDQMQKIMIAFDNLVMNMSIAEIRNHTGAVVPDARRNDKRTVRYASIYDCKLPGYFFADNASMKVLFYELYLYLLKVYSLYNDHSINNMDKVRELYRFMTKEIDLFLGFEFYMGVMLFIGVNTEKNIVTGIFKPREHPELQHIMNCAIDIFQYRMACWEADEFKSLGKLVNIVLVTADKYLQEYIDHNSTYNTVISANAITPINVFNVQISDKYRDSWDSFYNGEYSQDMHDRYMKAHLNNNTDATSIRDRIYRNICILEKEVLR